MAFQAGFLNIGGFMACHRFVSHVTGFATFFGLEVSELRIGPAMGMLLVPLFFLIGAMISGLLVDIRLKLQKKPRYYISFGLMFFLIVVVLVGGIFDHFGKFGEVVNGMPDYILLGTLCLTCGIQNGLVTTVSRSVIRTTHLTGITTDLGLGLMRVLNRSKLPSLLSDEVRANLMRLGIIFFFGFGSVAGGVVFRRSGYFGFSIPAAITGALFVTTMYFQTRSTPRSRATDLTPKSP